jgi:pimeloyl-ACP methyl ester carboxylesterase
VKLQVHGGAALWTGGSAESDLDVWFLHALGDSHLCFRHAFAHPLAKRARLFVFDLPGHGASPPWPSGLTVADAAVLWRDLAAQFSDGRDTVLVGHSMAAIVATRAARMLARPPKLVVSVEGNLTAADAYFTGKAARFDDAGSFYAWFQAEILRLAQGDEIFRRFSCSLQFADPLTLWTLGRSVAEFPDPGGEYLKLTCPSAYYWSPESTTGDAQAFLARHPVRQRRLEGLGHWPMVKSPDAFYAAIERDAA